MGTDHTPTPAQHLHTVLGVHREHRHDVINSVHCHNNTSKKEEDTRWKKVLRGGVLGGGGGGATHLVTTGSGQVDHCGSICIGVVDDLYGDGGFEGCDNVDQEGPQKVGEVPHDGSVEARLSRLWCVCVCVCGCVCGCVCMWM